MYDAGLDRFCRHQVTSPARRATPATPPRLVSKLLCRYLWIESDALVSVKLLCVLSAYYTKHMLSARAILYSQIYSAQEFFAGVFYCVVSNDLPSRRFAGPTALKPPAAITRSARSLVLLRYAGPVAFNPPLSGERQLQVPRESVPL